MALIVVKLTDTFNEWREKDNQSIAQIGDLAALTATNSASIVGALNGMIEEVKDDLTPQLGGPLDVNDKAIVSAVGTNKNINITPDGSGKAIITKGTYSGELGADLVLNSNDITGTGNVNFTGVLTATSIAGTVTGTTQLQSDNSTKFATTAWAKAYADAIILTEDTLEEMNDTTMVSKTNLDVLQYDSSGGGAWKNRTMTAAGIPTTGFTVAMAIALG